MSNFEQYLSADKSEVSSFSPARDLLVNAAKEMPSAALELAHEAWNHPLETGLHAAKTVGTAALVGTVTGALMPSERMSTLVATALFSTPIVASEVGRVGQALEASTAVGADSQAISHDLAKNVLSDAGNIGLGFVGGAIGSRIGQRIAASDTFGAPLQRAQRALWGTGEEEAVEAKANISGPLIGSAEAPVTDLSAGQFGPRAVQFRPMAGGDEVTNLEVTLLKQQRNPKAREAQVEATAHKLAEFISGTKESLHTAIYDFRIHGKPGEEVLNALNAKAAELPEGAVKIAYFDPSKPHSGGEKSEADAAAPPQDFVDKLNPKIKLVPSEDGIDLQKGNSGSLSDDVATKGILGGGHLMHNKFMVRDGQDVWTGSTNFTDSAFGDQDNNIVTLTSKKLGAAYEKDFSQMWDSGEIARAGKGLTLSAKMGEGSVTASFSPGDGGVIDNEISGAIAKGAKSIRIASMDISSEKILTSLNQAVEKGIKVDGIYDGPQMDQVVRIWKQWANKGSESSQTKLELWNKIKDQFVQKHSTPYSPDPGALHDFMHNKVAVVDGNTVVTGSFNFSKNATMNGENILMIDSAPVAQQYSNYIADLLTTYGPKAKR